MEGTVGKWLVRPGDHVQKYAPLAEVITDKVVAEVPSSYAGVVKEIVVAEGDTVAVGVTICTIAAEEVAPQSTSTEEKVHTKAELSKNTTIKRTEQVAEKEKRTYKNTGTANKKRYSPAVLKLSQEHGIDLSEVTGSGAGGRITRKDVLRWIASRDKTVQRETAHNTPQDMIETPEEFTQKRETRPTLLGDHFDGKNMSQVSSDKEIPLSPIQQVIADKMVQSKQEIPHAWMMVEVDVTNIVNNRNTLKSEFAEKEGFSLTYFPFFVKAVAQALKEFPQMNAIWAGNKIVQKQAIHISIAVATEEALYVPVIHHADEKTVKAIAKEIALYSSKARAGKLTASDMQGGTFTVNNTGAIGSIQSMGIINYPQVAILQVEMIKKRPVIINEMIAVREMVNLCLSLDHRVLDGFICGRFLKRVKEILGNISGGTSSLY